MSKAVVGVAAIAFVFAFAAGGAKRKPAAGKSGADRLCAHAKAEFAEGKYAAVVRDLTSAIQIEGPDVEMYRLRAEAYMKLRDWPNATGDYDRILALGYQHASIYNSRAEALSKQGQSGKAIESYSRGIKLRLDDPAPWK